MQVLFQKFGTFKEAILLVNLFPVNARQENDLSQRRFMPTPRQNNHRGAPRKITHPTVVVAVVGLTNNVPVRLSSASAELPVNQCSSNFTSICIYCF